MTNKLDRNERTGEYVLTTTNDDEAKAAGLVLSTRARGPAGERVYFTKEPYAALPFWEVATERARLPLVKLKEDYDASFAVDAYTDAPCPPDRDYMPFQRAGIEYARRRKDVVIGDEMGLGKTVQAVGVANLTGAEKILVVCPGAIRLNWAKEIRNWSVIPKVRPYPVLASKDGISPYSNYTIISYDLARNEGIHSVLCSVKWDLLILDEVHYLKTLEAQRTRAIFGGGDGVFRTHHVAANAEQIVALTGTPLPNRPRECYTVARALCWEAIDWMSYEAFTYRFNPSGVIQNREGDLVNIEKKGRLPELQARLRSNFMIRRLKADVLKDLPDKRYEFNYVEPNGAIKEVLAKEKLIDFNPNELKDPWSEIWGQISTVRREMGEAKVPRIIEHMRYLLDVMGVHKVALFANHRSVMDDLAEALGRYGVVQVRGGMSPKAKHASVQEFISDPDLRIFQGQLEAAGTGIDGLQGVCSHVVLAEPSWTPGGNEQIIDRLHRIGQHDNVVAQFLVVEGSFDERVLYSVLDKAHTIHDSLDRRF